MTATGVLISLTVFVLGVVTFVKYVFQPRPEQEFITALIVMLMASVYYLAWKAFFVAYAS